MFRKLKGLVSCIVQEYAEFLQEFMCAVKQNYGEKVLVQVNYIISFLLKTFVFSIMLI